MANRMWLLVAIMCLVAPIWGQVPGRGPCPNVNLQKNFNVGAYMGQWFEMYRFFAIFEATSTCVSAQYALNPDGSVMVNNTGLYPLFGYRSVVGDAVADPTNPARLAVRFFPNQPRGDYWVLSTDYSSYSVVWSCTERNWGPFTWNSQFAWLLTRQPDGIPTAKVQELQSYLESFGIDTSRFSQTPQNNCP